MKRWKATIVVFVLAVGLMAVPPLYHFSQGNLSTPELPSKTQTDAVMVFTGASERLTEGYKSYVQGIAKKIMVTGDDFPRDARAPDTRKLSKKIRRDDIYVDLEATNTIENAENGAEWALKNHVKSILLITSEGHMPRAYFELRRLLPETVKIYTDSVPGSRDKYAGVDSEKSRLFCRLYETATDTDFCYKTRDLARNLGL